MPYEKLWPFRKPLELPKERERPEDHHEPHSSLLPTAHPETEGRPSRKEDLLAKTSLSPVHGPTGASKSELFERRSERSYSFGYRSWDRDYDDDRPYSFLSSWREPEIPKHEPLRSRDRTTPALHAKSAAEVFGVPELEPVVDAALQGPHAAALQPLLESASLLAEEMRVAPDFAGGRSSHIGERSSYRTRSRFHAASGRQTTEPQEFGKALAQALAEQDPVAPVGRAITHAFLHGIGLPEAKRTDLNPKLDEVLKLIDQEAFTPLRAMVETIHRDATKESKASDGWSDRWSDSWKESGRDKAAKEAAGVGEKALHDALTHLVAGTFRQWRATAGAAHLDAGVSAGFHWHGLTDAQKAAWAEDLETTAEGSGGTKLRTRDVKDAEVLWVGKVQNASHSFEGSGGHRHALSLLLNERSHAVVVEDPRYSEKPGFRPLPAARIYLKVQAYPDGQRVLIAEHDAVDNGYKDRFNRADQDALRRAMIAHVVEKAKRVGLPVSFIDESRDSFVPTLKELGVPFERVSERYLVLPSVSGFESSTRLADHDRPQVTASPSSGWHGGMLQRVVVKPPAGEPT